MMATLRVGMQIKIDDLRRIEIKEIDPRGKWVKVKTTAPEHATVEKAEQPTTSR